MSRSETIRRLRAEVAAAQDALRPHAETIERLEAQAELGEADAKALAEAEAKAGQLVATIEAKRAELDRESAALERERALSPVRVPAGDMVSREPDPVETAGFSRAAEFFAAVKAASAAGNTPDPRLLAGIGGAQATTTTRDSEGFTIPPAFRPGPELLIGDSGILAELDAEPTSAPSITMDADETTPWGSGGVQAYWKAEAAQMTPSDPGSEPRTVPIDTIYALVKASDELVADAPRLEARIERKAPMKIRWKMLDAVVRGAGAGRPKGFLSSPSLVSVAKENDQPGDTIVRANVLKMFPRLLRTEGAAARARWMANPDTFEQLMGLNAEADAQPIFTLAGASGDVDGYLLGRPLRFVEVASALGDVGDLVLYDPLGYYLPIRQSITRARSMHVFFDYGVEAFRFTARVGGQTHLAAPVAAAKGSATRSHFVALAAR